MRVRYLDSNLTSHAQVLQHVAVFKKNPEGGIIWRIRKKGKWQFIRKSALVQKFCKNVEQSLN